MQGGIFIFFDFAKNLSLTRLEREKKKIFIYKTVTIYNRNASPPQLLYLIGKYDDDCVCNDCFEWIYLIH